MSPDFFSCDEEIPINGNPILKLTSDIKVHIGLKNKTCKQWLNIRTVSSENSLCLAFRAVLINRTV